MTLQLVGHWHATFAEVWACAHGAHQWFEHGGWNGQHSRHCLVCGAQQVDAPPTRGAAE